MDNTNQEMLIMNLIVDAGNARSFSMQAIQFAKEGKFDEARATIEEANEALSKVHGLQTDLIQKEARGERTEINLFMVHAQDHIMTAMLARDLAREIIELHELISQK